jgi:AraC-like DNA-binding protein
VNYGYQLAYLFTGRGTATVQKNDYALLPGSLLLYGPREWHEVRTDSHELTEMATVYFSWQPPGEKRLALGNKSVFSQGDLDQSLCDPPTQVQGLPPTPFHISLSDSVRAKAERALRATVIAYRSHKHDLSLLHRARFMEFLHLVISSLSGDTSRPDLFDRLYSFMVQNLSRPLRRKEVSNHLGISESYLTTLLRSKYSTSLTELLLTERMAKAQELLLHTELKVKEIAAKVGFRDTSFFVLSFRKRFGIPPLAFRDKGGL